ncbi:helix-turn-helix domain-containing protein [Streptosporangium sp. NPDC006013]|uniref:helix-turn-helix domain-containing protein n=1 Tax=Streptosporangium sp. NPDC006013 TaxID=3155596 RepID=UPI0033ADDC9B
MHAASSSGRRHPEGATDMAQGNASVADIAPPPRRSQAERSAATRAKILTAARDVLQSQGYSGATMSAIRDAAGMSLGAIQYQYSSKAKLMAAVVEDLSARRAEIYADAIQRGATPRASMENLIDANLALASQPEAAAALEIHLARRNDPELDEEVAPIALQHDRQILSWSQELLHSTGIDATSMESLQLLSNAVTRGLTVEYIRNRDQPAIDRAATLWRAQMLALLFGTSEEADESCHDVH